MQQRQVKRLAGLLLCWLLLALGAGPARAHPADMYTQTYTLRLAPAQGLLEWSMSPGPLLAASVWHEADSDGNGTVTETEAGAWLAPLLAGWESSAGDKALDWTLTAVSWPADLVAFEIGDEAVVASLAAVLPADLPAAADLSLHNPYAESISINWFYVYGEEGVTFARPQQENGRLVVPLDPAAGFSYWDSGTPALSAGSRGPENEEREPETAVVPSVPSPPEDTRPYARLTGLVRAQEMSLLFLLTALGISLVLGGMHALTPGHGKALVAAYLVGSRGTPRHAAALGGVVTLTHTGSVLAIGLVTLAASRFLVPTDLFPILEIASGLLIMAMGIGLLQQRWRGWRGVQRKRAAERAAAVREAKGLAAAREPLAVNRQPADESVHEAEGAQSRTRLSIGADIPTKVYDDVLTDESGARMVRWRSLVALGVSGGLVPCPDAIAILLVAVAINRIALGLSLIVAFSLGLALILIAIGLAMVQSRRLMARFGRVERFAPAISVASALIVLALGGALTWNAASGAGFLARSGVAETAVSPKQELSARQPKAATGFSLGSARVLYQVLDEQGLYQLYSVPAVGGDGTKLTQTADGIWNFSAAPDGKTIIFAALRPDRGSDLWIMDANGSNQRLLLACPAAACRNATFAPDGRRIVYERLDTSPENVTGSTTLWWLDLDSRETAAVFQDSSLPGFSPAWSPDGTWLSYVAPAMPTKIQLYNLADGRSHEFPTMTSMKVVWHPQGSSLLLTDINRDVLQPGQQALTHLLRFDVATAELVDISIGEDVSDSWPDWSAEGEWVAFVRRVFRNGQPQRGNQLWVMRANGSEARPVTDSPNTLHQNPDWSPDGRFLLFHHYDLDEPLAKPAVWLVDVTTGELQLVANPGSNPVWLTPLQ